MTLIKLYTVNCDGQFVGVDPTGCQGWIANSDTGREARREARLGGWRVRAGRDLCPSCDRKASLPGLVSGAHGDR